MAEKKITGCGLTINAVTAKGGAAVFNAKHGVWASYAVATAGDFPLPEVLYARAKLSDGRTIQFFFDRETGLVAVDVNSTIWTKTGLSADMVLGLPRIAV